MAETTARLGLPLLQAGQAQKELYHNEALALLDIVAGAGVESIGLATPPVSPVEGQCWIVGSGAVGDWSGATNAIAGWTAGGWRFVTPRAGMTAYSVADQLFALFDGTRWVLGDVLASRIVIGGHAVVGPRRAAIDSPSGGTTVDAEVRLAVNAVLAALRAHGLIES